MSSRNKKTQRITVHDAIHEYPGLPLSKFNKLVNLTLKRLFKSVGCDITREQEVILRELCRSDGINQAKLAIRVGQDRNNLSRTLSLLEHRGLIKKDVHGADKRNTDIRITRTGRKLHAQAFEAIEMYWNILFDGLSPREVQTFSENINKLSENLAQFVNNETDSKRE